MAIITKPSVNKNSAATFTLNKADLALVSSVVANTYFADPANWKEVSISYKSAEGNQRTAVVFDAAQSTPEGQFFVSDKARDTFEVQKIIIRDFDGGRFEVLRTELNEAEFDVAFQILSFTLFAGGDNSSGQLGVGPSDYTSRDTLTITSGTNKYKSVATGSSHTLAIKEDGTLWAAGTAASGQTGGATGFGLFAQVGSANNWKQVSCGYSHSMAIKEDGTLWATGNSTYWQTGLNTTNDVSTFTQVGTDTNWKYVHATEYRTYAIKENGTLWAVGYGGDGNFGNGDNSLSVTLTTFTQIGTDTDWEKIVSGFTLTVAMKTNGDLYAAGRNPSNIPGYETNRIWINNVSVEPRASFTPVPGFNGLNTAKSLHRFYQTFMAVVRNDGTLHVIGNNNSGQLGLGNTTQQNNFVQVGTDTDWTDAYCDAYCTVALKEDKRMFAAGSSSSFALSTNSNIFTEVDQNIYGVATNYISGYALKDYTPPPPPPEPVSSNFTSTVSSTFQIGNTRPIVADNYYGPSGYNIGSTDLTHLSSWIPYGAFIASSVEESEKITRDPSKSSANASTFNGGGSSGSPFSIVLDLGEVRTFNQARFYQTFSDGKTTHAAIDVSSSGNLETRTSANWTPVTFTNSAGTTEGTVQGGYIVLDNSNTSSGVAANFTTISARYIRVRLYNDGRYSFGSYTELYNMKLFLVA